MGEPLLDLQEFAPETGEARVNVDIDVYEPASFLDAVADFFLYVPSDEEHNLSVNVKKQAMLVDALSRNRQDFEDPNHYILIDVSGSEFYQGLGTDYVMEVISPHVNKAFRLPLKTDSVGRYSLNYQQPWQDYSGEETLFTGIAVRSLMPTARQKSIYRTSGKIKSALRIFLDDVSRTLTFSDHSLVSAWTTPHFASLDYSPEYMKAYLTALALDKSTDEAEDAKSDIESMIDGSLDKFPYRFAAMPMKRFIYSDSTIFFDAR